MNESDAPRPQEPDKQDLLDSLGRGLMEWFFGERLPTWDCYSNRSSVSRTFWVPIGVQAMKMPQTIRDRLRSVQDVVAIDMRILMEMEAA